MFNTNNIKTISNFHTNMFYCEKCGTETNVSKERAMDWYEITLCSNCRRELEYFLHDNLQEYINTLLTMQGMVRAGRMDYQKYLDIDSRIKKNCKPIIDIWLDERIYRA